MITECFQSIAEGGELLQALGWLFAGAMLIGAILDDGYKQLVDWLLAVLIFAIALQLVHAFFLSSMELPLEICKSGSITGITTLFYGCGLTAGWMVVFLAKKRVRSKVNKGAQK